MTLLVKVCGLTSGSDAAQAREAGADLLGFVVHPPSPRHCPDLVSASAGVQDLGVLVMVADEAAPMVIAAHTAGLGWIQPHVPPAVRATVVGDLRAAGFKVLLPWADEPGQGPLPADLYLWEPSPARTGVAGGSGQTHAMGHPPPGPFLLAGGLDPDNLRARLDSLPAEARPFLRGVDAASRLEAAPGLKDPARVSAFLSAARTWSPA